MTPIPTLRMQTLGALAAGLLPLGAQTILIDYDDGDAGNGIHDAIVNDGEFTEGLTGPWVSLGTGAIQFNAAGAPAAPTGSPQNYISASDRVLGLDTGHTVSASDIFDFSYQWIDKANFNDATDTIQMVLYVTDNDLIDGADVETIVLNSGLSTANSTWEEKSATGVAFSGAAVGKTLFVRIENLAGATGRFARHDNIYLKVETGADPTLSIAGSASPDFAFGDLFHATGTDSTVRTVTFENTGVAESITIDAITLTGAPVFSVTNAPDAATVIAPGETFSVEITATGGGGFQTLSGELLVDVSHANSPANDQDQVLPVTAMIATTGDPYPVISNGSLDNGLAGWTGGAVSVPGMVAGSGARVRGIGDDRDVPGTGFATNLAQAFRLGDLPDFTLTCSIAIPDFEAWTDFAPFPDSFDRSFHLAVLASATTTGNAVFGSADNANTLVNLFYFPAGTNDGAGNTTPAGFHLFDGSTGLFVHLPELGTLAASTDADLDGALTPGGADTLNVYQLTITGTGFGTPGASYDIAISDANASTIAGTASGLTISHGTDIAAGTARAIVFTTADSETDSETNPGDPPAYQPSFWVDEVGVSNGLTLPVALLDLVEAPPYLQMRPKSRTSLSFTLGNAGLHEDLTLTNPVLSDPRFRIVSPTVLPVTIAPGETQVFELEFDSRASADTNDVAATLTADTNDGIMAQRTLDLSIRILPDGKLALIDYDDGIPGNGIHEASIRSGGFEDNLAGQTFAEAEPWFSRFAPEALDTILALDSDPAAGLLHGLTSGWQNAAAGDRTQPAQLIALEEWTLAEGDSFTIEVTWKDGPIFDTVTPAQLGAIIEVFDANGALVNDPLNFENIASRILSREQPLETAGEFQTFTTTSRPIQPGSPWIGHRPLLRFLVTGGTSDRSHTALIDNVSLVAHVLSDQLVISDFSFDPGTGDATLRWNNTRQGYKVQSSGDLTFGEGTVEFPVGDAEADYTTYPGEVQFRFNDPNATPGPRFWRVVAE